MAWNDNVCGLRLRHGDNGALPCPVQFLLRRACCSPSAAGAATDNFTDCRVGNPAAVYDAVSGVVMLAFVVRGFGAGEDPIGNGICRSTDGKSWDKPTDVSAGFAGVKAPIAGMPGPGTAIFVILFYFDAVSSGVALLSCTHRDASPILSDDIQSCRADRCPFWAVVIDLGGD